MGLFPCTGASLVHIIALLISSRFQMGSFVGLASFAPTYNHEQDNFTNQDKYADECVVSVCRMLLNKEKEMSPSRRNSAYAHLVIEKLFGNKSIDLCGIFPPATDVQSEQQPFNLVYQVINSKSLFFETILEADDALSNELWFAIGQQADRSAQPTSISTDSVLMRIVSFYVTRLLPIESTVPNIGCGPLVNEVGHRKRTPLDLFLPTSPLVNSIKLESQEFYSSALHPRHLTIFCNFVTVLCNTSDFPSANRLMMLRYLLKQFHVFCLYDVGDQDTFSVKSSFHCRPSFSSHLYSFLYTFLEQCPTTCVFKDLVQCWMTFSRPWRYADTFYPTLSDQEFLRGPWMPFIRVHEKFYRILLGKIFRKAAMFNLTADTIRVVRAVAEFSWKEPMVMVLRELGVNARPHTRDLLERVSSNLRSSKESVLLTKREKRSFLQFLFGVSVSPSTNENHQVIKSVEDLLVEADANMGTHFVTQTNLSTTTNTNSSSTNSYYAPFSETPKRAPRLLPDHVRDPVTGLMYLTDLGKRQVWSGERWV
ncbi:hypothetical protein KIN20_017160 [Parelaphostrongylus tenuis]|uniref:Uncharacterized protein n=1 Tax=Parelaphostrongylus tenuis TaxID=148309 RepID=A0AAD5QRA3_PARTN|nr:hypothetical protein KIN20_017160 [Parelaphostrongylus tenuis]